MEKLLLNNKVYSFYEYPLEKEFEQIIVENSAQIFGKNSIYIDIKKRIGDNIYLLGTDSSTPTMKYVLHTQKHPTHTSC